MPLKFGSIADASREASLESLSSPNPSANLAPTSGAKKASLRIDSSANVAPLPKGTIKVLSCEAGTGALCSAKYLRSKAKSKTPLRAKGEVTTTSLPNSSGAKFTLGVGVTSVASPSAVNTTDKVISKSYVVKNRSLNARVSQPEQPSTDRLESLYTIM